MKEYRFKYGFAWYVGIILAGLFPIIITIAIFSTSVKDFQSFLIGLVFIVLACLYPLYIIPKLLSQASRIESNGRMLTFISPIMRCVVDVHDITTIDTVMGMMEIDANIDTFPDDSKFTKYVKRRGASIDGIRIHFRKSNVIIPGYIDDSVVKLFLADIVTADPRVIIRDYDLQKIVMEEIKIRNYPVY